MCPCQRWSQTTFHILAAGWFCLFPQEQFNNFLRSELSMAGFGVPSSNVASISRAERAVSPNKKSACLFFLYDYIELPHQTSKQDADTVKQPYNGQDTKTDHTCSEKILLRWKKQPREKLQAVNLIVLIWVPTGLGRFLTNCAQTPDLTGVK